MEAFDNDLNTELESHNTQKCRICGYVGEKHEFDPECPECHQVDDGYDEEEDLFSRMGKIFKP